MENKVYKKYKGGAGAWIHEKNQQLMSCDSRSWFFLRYSGKCQPEKKDFFELKLYSHSALE